MILHKGDHAGYLMCRGLIYDDKVQAFTIAEALVEAIAGAESLLGPAACRLVGLHFAADGPYLSYPFRSKRSAIPALTISASDSIGTAAYQLGGLAAWASDERYSSSVLMKGVYDVAGRRNFAAVFGYDDDSPLTAAGALVSSMLARSPNFLRLYRERFGPLKGAIPGSLRAVLPGVADDHLQALCSPKLSGPDYAES